MLCATVRSHYHCTDRVMRRDDLCHINRSSQAFNHREIKETTVWTHTCSSLQLNTQAHLCPLGQIGALLLCNYTNQSILSVKIAKRLPPYSSHILHCVWQNMVWRWGEVRLRGWIRSLCCVCACRYCRQCIFVSVSGGVLNAHAVCLQPLFFSSKADDCEHIWYHTASCP